MYDVSELSDGLVKLTFGRDVASKPWLAEGALLWRTSDALVDAKLKRLASSATVKRTAVDVAVSVQDGRLTVTLTDSKHTVVEEVVVALGDERRRRSLQPGSAGAPNAMRVVLHGLRHVEIDDLSGGNAIDFALL